MMREIVVDSGHKVELLDVTQRVQAAVRETGVTQGVCQLFVPHTTAGLAVNEAADPDVSLDLVTSLERMVPGFGPYRHREGNSPAHLKAVLVGPSLGLLVEGGTVLLGTWQGIFLCEFDGPRRRKIWVKVLKE
ncbi:MAG: secondary thiamine-phosphate synthase enzyme YjbQ [Thermaerobacter sp.]|jgi:secondary thiamine-phosphate synthase enzyme|nr:secondary thiamine-phosphate synthase enzyme YjbQ [Thermaerobacter sp.]